MLKDPYLTLGLDRKTTDEMVRTAYLDAIRIFPPEKSPEDFQRIQSAYETIKTQRLRLKHELFFSQMPSPEDLMVLAASKATRTSSRPSLASIQALLR